MTVTPRVVTQVTGANKAKQVRLLCPHCYGCVYVTLDWTPFAGDVGGGSYVSRQNQQKKREAIEEHRKLCSAAPPEAGRVFQIEYPRG